MSEGLTASTRMLRAVAAVTIGALLAPALASPTAGACDGPVPSFREAAATATTIVVGTVVRVAPVGADPPGYASVFELRVDHVLRGESPEMLSIRRLPQSPCSGVLLVPDSAVIALALDGRAFSPPLKVNAPAFIEGRSWRASVGAAGPAEVMTLEEVFAVAGVPLPDSALQPPRGAGPAAIGILLLTTAAGLGVFRRRRFLSTPGN